MAETESTPVGYKDVDVCYTNVRCCVVGDPPEWIFRTKGTLFRQCGGAYYGKRRLIDVCVPSTVFLSWLCGRIKTKATTFKLLAGSGAHC